MKVTLINYTNNAEDMLLFTKSTRLNMTPYLIENIKNRSNEDKLKEIKYIANTIPSSWEFIDYVFLVEDVSRAYTHQQVRTRFASYAQQAMRIVPMKNFGYVYTDRNLENPKAIKVIDECLVEIKKAYAKLLDMGQLVEDARGILPTNVMTNITCKFNLRAFADLVRSRAGGRVQSEYRAVIQAMVAEVLKVHPWAEQFIFPEKRNYFNEIEAFADKEYRDNLVKKAELLKIVDKMRKEAK